jgi:hypothetical protein
MGKVHAIALADNHRQWSTVLEAQDALDCLATMVEVCEDNEVPVPATISTLLRMIGRTLDEPLGIASGG